MEHPIKKHVVVIGGVNMDICGDPSSKLILRDSNPGIITVKPGGVGRNIAHNLTLLGMDVSLIAAVGGDVYASGILESCRDLHIDVSMCRVVSEMRSSVYLYINDGEGDMCAAVSDMDIVSRISPLFLAKHIHTINRADAVVIDANLSEEAIEYLAEHCTVPIYADPVSTAKALRLKKILPKLRAIKPNALEAAALTGESDPVAAAEKLLETGVEQVFISLGKDGMLGAQADEILRIPRVKANVVDTTGAGDAATAAIVAADLLGRDLASVIHASLAAGALTTECTETNNPALAKLIL